MPKYLWRVTYTPEGACELLDEGGTARASAIADMVERAGGVVEACYFALGGADMYVIGDVPDEIAAAALGMRTTAGGRARSEAITLLTPRQLDRATAGLDGRRPAERRRS